MRIMSFAISRPFGWRMFSEMPRLPEFLLRKLPPMSGSLTPGSGPVATSRAARPPTGAIPASRGEKPREIEDPDALEREWLVVRRRESGVLYPTRLGGHARPARPFRQH